MLMNTKLMLNVEKSRQMYTMYTSCILKKACFNNVARIALHNQSMLESLYPNIHIAYGSWSIVVDTLHAKHCFFIQDNEVIDPTYFGLETKIEKYPSYAVAVQLRFQDYFFALLNDHQDPSLERYMRPYYEQLRKTLEKEKIVLCG